MVDVEKCEACGDSKGKIGAHHWYDKRGKLHSKRLCRSCNSILRSPGGDHVMPPWSEQLKILKNSCAYQWHRKELTGNTDRSAEHPGAQG